MVKNLELPELYSEKDRYFDLMMDNLKEQLALIKSGNFESLLEVQNQWEKLSFKINSLDGLITKNSLAEDSFINEVSDFKRILGSKGLQLEKLNEVLQAELKIRLQQIRDQLQQINTSYHTAGVYKVKTKETPKFIDKNI